MLVSVGFRLPKICVKCYLVVTYCFINSLQTKTRTIQVAAVLQTSYLTMTSLKVYVPGMSTAVMALLFHRIQHIRKKQKQDWLAITLLLLIVRNAGKAWSKTSLTESLRVPLIWFLLLLESQGHLRDLQMSWQL